jgi:hypothetical protein
MASTFSYVSPSKMFALFGTPTGSLDATYQPAYLVDGRTDWPVRKTGSSISLTITGTAQDVDTLCMGHHNIRPAATINITGGITTTLTVPTWPSNNIPLNAYRTVTLVAGVTTLTLAVTGQTESACVIGEFCAGLAQTLPLTLHSDSSFSEDDFRVTRPMDMAFIPPHDKAMKASRWTGTGLLTTAQLAQVRDWQDATRSNTRPSLIIASFLGSTEAKFVQFLGLTSIVPVGPALFKVALSFQEYPRRRW